MPTVLRIIVPILLGYLLGGVPVGAIVVRAITGKDLTKSGSGSTGATNVFRALGWKAAVPVALADAAKGAIPTAVAMWLAATPGWSQNARDLLAISAGLAAVIGHSYSPFLRLKGGKGVATAGGMALAVMPWVLVWELALWGAVLVTVRIVSVASIVMAIGIVPMTYLVYQTSRPVLLGFAAVISVLILWRHRSNIGRIMRGEERRMARRTSGTEAQAPADGEAKS